ncbi:hypothetical protein TNCT_102431 [Trichonephila clavata]|uniref:Uncharacterized protein n=1 Tax=Trichonephila clavata TaxID=2740835 RepID=A0A8X6FFA7_TRICU|nr:hypothetical protein TNCT_102431 [Trichonephila clavata]
MDKAHSKQPGSVNTPEYNWEGVTCICSSIPASAKSDTLVWFHLRLNQSIYFRRVHRDVFNTVSVTDEYYAALIQEHHSRASSGMDTIQSH